jgi:hypothetical protein
VADVQVIGVAAGRVDRYATLVVDAVEVAKIHKEKMHK